MQDQEQTLRFVTAKVEQQTKNKEELLKAEAQAQLQLVVVQDLVEQLLPVTYEQLVEKVHASVGEKRVAEAKDTLEAPVVQCSQWLAPWKWSLGQRCVPKGPM